jgi:asparagine synthase (glutamine-hydrolysing)
LSGGLDSSAVVMTAAGRARVRAVTYSGPLADVEDTALARRVAELTGVEHHVCEGDETTWHFAVPPPTSTDGPSLAAATYGLDAAYLAPVAGEPVHLTGHGGDVVLESSTAAFTDLLQRGWRRTARDAVTAHARGTDRAPGPLWRQVKIAARGREHTLRAAADHVASGRTVPDAGLWSWCRLGPAAQWLTPEGRTAVTSLLHAAADQADDVPAGEWDDWAALRFTGAIARNEEPLLDALDIRPAHPFLDNGMVRACFAVPAVERRRTGSYKPLLAAARPDLPGWLTGRGTKGSFGPVLLSGLRAHRGRLHRMLAASSLTAVFDMQQVGAALNAAAAGDARAPLAAVHQILTTCLWLENLPATPARALEERGTAW